MNLKDKIHRVHTHNIYIYRWMCSRKELLNFKIWAELVNIPIFWGQWINDNQVQRELLNEEGFPLDKEEYNYLVEYLNTMEE